jgi:hypothetical protein
VGLTLATRRPGEWPVWVRLGRADHLPGARMRGRCSPVSGPKWGGRIEAALGHSTKSLRDRGGSAWPRAR